jgi:O-acetyl-ADP-ribose deacetylase
MEMTRRTLGQLEVECRTGDIAAQTDMDVVVNAANAQLQPGGGVAGAIHQAAGPGLAQECQPFAPIAPGHAVITGAYKLPNRYVVHCLGPVYGYDEPPAELLAACYRNALALADKAGARSVAFPAISTGSFGYPIALAARVAMRAVAAAAPELRSVRRVRFVLYSEADEAVHAAALAELED